MQLDRKAFPRHARGPLVTATYLHRRQGYRICGGVASLLVVLSLVLVERPWAGAPPPGEPSVPRLMPRSQVAVHQGRLSVNLWETDIREVLVEIQYQSGIPISVSPGPEHKVSAQFTDVALDQGLRRLLQLASQSYAMRYALGPPGEVILQEVQVFSRAPVGNQSPAGAAQGGDEHGSEAGQRFVDALLQRQVAAPAVAREDESDAVRFREALERQAAPALERADAPASDAARRFREMLEGWAGATAR
jgi:type II secretory pathway component GspD/PulD (secretin)